MFWHPSLSAQLNVNILLAQEVPIPNQIHQSIPKSIYFAHFPFSLHSTVTLPGSQTKTLASFLTSNLSPSPFTSFLDIAFSNSYPDIGGQGLIKQTYVKYQ